MRKTVLNQVLAGLAVSVCVLSGASSASASTSSDDPSVEVLDQLNAVAPEVASEIVAGDSSSTDDGSAAAVVTEDTLTLTSEVGSFELKAPGVNGNEAVEPFVLDDASAMFAIRLNNADAARNYDFEITTADDVTGTIMKNGGVIFTNTAGEAVGVVAAPWAKDAAGKDIPTWFTLKDGVLTQSVGVDSVENVVYPVIADPYAGQYLVQSAWVTWQPGNSGYVVHAVPSAIGTQVQDQAFLGEWTKDLKTKLGSNAYLVSSSIENQYHCHVIYTTWGGGGPTWDMESWRPDIWWWVQAAAGCNP